MTFLTLVFPMSLGVLLCTEKCLKVMDCSGVCFDKIHLTCTLKCGKNSDPQCHSRHTQQIPKVKNCDYKSFVKSLNIRQPESTAVSEEKGSTTSSQSEGLSIVKHEAKNATRKHWTGITADLILIFTQMTAPRRANQTYLYLTKSKNIVELPYQDTPKCGAGVINRGKYTIFLGSLGIRMYTYIPPKEIVYENRRETRYAVATMAADQFRLALYYSQWKYLVKWDLMENTHRTSDGLPIPICKIIVHSVSSYISVYYMQQKKGQRMLYFVGRKRGEAICTNKNGDMSVDKTGQVYYANYTQASPNCSPVWPHQKDLKCVRVNVIADFTLWTCPSHRYPVIIDRDGWVVEELNQTGYGIGDGLTYLGYVDTKVKPWYHKMKLWDHKMKLWTQKVNPWKQKVEPWKKKVKPWTQKKEPWKQKVKPWNQKVKPRKQKVEPWKQKVIT